MEKSFVSFQLISWHQINLIPVFTWQEHLIIELQPVSCYCEFVVMPQQCGGRVGESERGDLPFPGGRWRKGSPEFEFLPFKEVLCMPSWIGRFVPSLPWAFLSQGLCLWVASPLISSPHSGLWLVLLWSTGLCSPMMAPTMGPAHSINSSLKDQASQGGCPENGSHKPQVVHIWHSSNGEGRVVWKRKTWKDEAAKIEKKEAFSYFVELFLIIRIIHSEFPVS